jgi:hypothetical protein
MVAHPTPRSRATAATAWASLPTRRHASARGPLGQHRPRTDRGDLLGPGPHPAGLFATAPDPLAPQEHHRPPADWQVADPDRAAAVELGPHPTTPTANHGGHRLDVELPLATHHLGGENRKAVKAEQRRPDALLC